jgi:hypothetical protein
VGGPILRFPLTRHSIDPEPGDDARRRTLALAGTAFLHHGPRISCKRPVRVARTAEDHRILGPDGHTSPGDFRDAKNHCRKLRALPSPWCFSAPPSRTSHLIFYPIRRGNALAGRACVTVPTRVEKGDRSNLQDRPAGCCAQIGPVPFFSSVQDRCGASREERGAVGWVSSCWGEDQLRLVFRCASDDNS